MKPARIVAAATGPTFVTGILVVCAITITALALRREFSPSPLPVAAASVSQQLVVHDVPDWESLSTFGHVLGPDTAAVKLVEFSDFQRIHCAMVQAELTGILKEYPGKVAIVYRHYYYSSEFDVSVV